MKKILKEKKVIIIAFLIGVILASTIAVYAVTSATDITYTRTGTTITNVSEALNDLYQKTNIVPIEMNFEGVIMGKNVSRTSLNEAVKLDNLDNYKKITIQCGDNVGDYIDAYVYIDQELVLTITDKLEHEITLNNNSELKINCASKNNLGLGGINFYIKAE